MSELQIQIPRGGRAIPTSTFKNEGYKFSEFHGTFKKYDSNFNVVFSVMVQEFSSPSPGNFNEGQINRMWSRIPYIQHIEIF